MVAKVQTSWLIFLTIFAAVVCAWMIDRRRLTAKIRSLEREAARLTLYESVLTQIEQMDTSVSESYYLEGIEPLE
jgi:uncharacterized protein YpmB